MARDATPPAGPLGSLTAAVATPAPPSHRTGATWLRARLGDDWSRSLAVAWRATWISRLLVWVSGVAAYVIWGNVPQAAGFDPTGMTSGFGSVGNALMAPVARWDATWYASIADGGYGHDTSRPAFFPLYPLAMHVAGWFTGSAMVGGVFVSLAALLVALTALHRLTELEIGPEAARLTVWATALFPMAFFLSAVYSESLFLMFSVCCVLAARTDRWALAGVFGGLAAATRSAGVLLVVALALLFWAQHRERGTSGDTRWERALWIGLVPLGPLLICAWFAARGLDPLAPFHAQTAWMRSFTGPFFAVKDGAVAAWQGVEQLASGQREHVYNPLAGGDPMMIAWRNVVPFAFLLLAVPAVVGVFRRLPLAYGGYTVAALALPLSYPVPPLPLMSFARFLLVLFPLFMWAGLWMASGRPWRRQVVLGASAIGLVVATGMFATWHWVA